MAGSATLALYLGGCASSGLPQNAEVLPSGASAGAIKLARAGSGLQVLATHRRGVATSVDVGVDAGPLMLNVDPKVQVLDGAIDVAIVRPHSYNLNRRDASYGNDEKSWVRSGIAGTHPALIIGMGQLYAAASGSYCHTRSGWQPAGMRTEVLSPQRHLYGITLGGQSESGVLDSSRIAAEVSLMRFSGWRTQVMPSQSLQFPLSF
jgi:hypothetical protein